MTLAEADCYLEGIERRKRAGWEQTRALMGLVYSGFGGKGDIEMEFPWDDEDEEQNEKTEAEKRQEAEELEQLRQEAAEMERKLNEKRHGAGR